MLLLSDSNVQLIFNISLLGWLNKHINNLWLLLLLWLTGADGPHFIGNVK